jgi:thiol-disulfide isomerase/thioredoxin
MAPNRNKQGRFVSSTPVTVEDDSKITHVEALIHQGPITFVLVYADWCGHCKKYKPSWKDLEKTPGRTANIVSVRDDMLPKIPTIANAKIQGYPSVIKVTPTGQIEEYKVQGTEEVTNAMPNMRDMAEMKKELTQAPPPADSKIPGPQSGIVMTGGFMAESVLGSLLGAVKHAGPAALLLLGHSMLPRKRKTFKSPKRSSHRASTRRNRRSH